LAQCPFLTLLVIGDVSVARDGAMYFIFPAGSQPTLLLRLQAANDENDTFLMFFMISDTFVKKFIN